MLQLIVQQEEAVSEISFNYEELKKELAPKLEEYKHRTYDDSAIVLAKRDKAGLNNLSKAINAKKIEVKNDCLKPYNDFERKVKDLIFMIDGAVGEIDRQVKDYEERTKAEKREKIEEYFNENIGDLKALLPFDKIFDSKWLNTSTSMKSIHKDIDVVIAKTNDDLSIIDSIEEEFRTELKLEYLNTLDISVVLKKKQQLVERKKQLEELEKKRQEEKAIKIKPIEPAITHNEPEVPTPEETTPIVNFEPCTTDSQSMDEPNTQEIAVESEHVYEFAFKVSCTASQLNKLKAFLQENNINYARA